MKIHDKFQWKRLTPDDGLYFFGYYDRCPWNDDQTLHLALKVSQNDRNPLPGETAEIGVVTKDAEYTPLTTTRAWCQQQGSMTLWLKHKHNTFIYNDFDTEEKRLHAMIYEIGKGIVGRYDMPIYTMSPDGRWGVSLNFGRIPRRGYTYADTPIPIEFMPDLDNDGLFLVDMLSGKTSLLVSYRQMIEAHPVPFELDDVYIWLNHAIFNCDSTKLLWLFRDCHNPLVAAWKTYMYTVKLDGTDLKCPLPEVYWNGAISHQIWGRTPNEILIDARWRDRNNSDYLVFDETKLPLQAKLISKGMGPMSHTVFSPDGKWLLADTYPDLNSMQRLGLVDAATGDITVIGNFRHLKTSGYCIDARNDLHPRWSQDGKTVTVDSIHNRMRGIYMLDISELV